MYVGSCQLMKLFLELGFALRIGETAGACFIVGADIREAASCGQIASHGGGTSPSGHVGDGKFIFPKPSLIPLRGFTGPGGVDPTNGIRVFFWCPGAARESDKTQDTQLPFHGRAPKL